MARMDGHLLFDAEWAPNPRRVRIALAEKGVEVERIAIDLRADEQLGEAFLAINPRGTVPALRLPSGEMLTESVAICRYVDALFPDPPLFGVGAAEAATVEEWTRRVEAEGYAAVVYALRNARPGFAGRAVPGSLSAPQIPALVERAAAMWAAFLPALDARLAASEWLAGGRHGFADVTALVCLDFARAARLEWRGWPAIERWHVAASARPASAA